MVGKDERARSQQSISLCAFTDWVPICFCSVGGTQGGVVSEATWSGISSAPDHISPTYAVCASIMQTPECNG